MVSRRKAVAVVCALFCSEEKKRKKRIWTRGWLSRRGRYGLAILHQELEIDDTRPKDFRDLMRMDVEEFNILLQKVAPLITRQDTHLRRAIPAKERLSVTLRFLATGETFNSLSFQYRIGSTTLSRIVLETCDALHRVLKDDFLKTPTSEEEWHAIAKEYWDKWQYPNCLGALDGKHIYIQPPKHSGSLFHNYKSRFSILLMAVVDAHYKFIYVNVGVQGRVSDAGLFAKSDLKRAMDCNLLHFPSAEPLRNTDVQMPYMLVADEAYPLRTDVMKPYPHRQLNREQRLFNYRLSRARRTVENAFGILANRWRVFLSTICLEPDKVVRLTMASVCLHNFLRERRSNVYVPPAYVDWEDENHQLVRGTWRQEGQLESAEMGRARNPAVAAKQQREQLREYFNSPAGSVSWQEDHI